MMALKMPRSCAFAFFTSIVSAVGMLVSAHAAALLAKTNGPGLYRAMLGKFEVTAIPDDTVELPIDKLLTNTKPAVVQKALAKHYLKAPVETSVNAFLVNTGEKLVLIDTGAA